MDPLTLKLPQNIEAEECVIGSMLLDNDVIGLVTEIIEAGDFHDRRMRELFEAAVDLFERDKCVDAVTLKDRLVASSRLDEVGGVEALVRVMEAVPSAAHVTDYAHIVRDRAIKRRLIHLANEVVRDAYDSEDKAEKLIEKVESEVFKIGRTRGGDEPAAMGQVLHGTIELIEKLTRTRGQITGCATDYYRLDDMTNGFQPGDLVILAARPSVGKTTFAVNCALRTALRHNNGVALFSLEMSREQLAMNMLCAESGVKAHHLRKGNLNQSEWNKIVDAAGRLHDARIYIDDTPGLSTTALRGKARRLKQQFDIDMVVIDYLQLMDAPRAESRQQEISTISRSLKALARELSVPVMALSQINRAAEKEDRKPRMSDLRESGAIEQDADIVMFLWRPDYQKLADDDQPVPDPSQGRPTELIIAKQRNGPTGRVDLLFFPDKMRFEPAAHSYDES